MDSLLGFALGHAGEQLSTQQPVDLRKQPDFWSAMQWLTAAELITEFATSQRLHSSEAGGVYQKDTVRLNTNHSRTSNWAAVTAVETLYHSEILADLKSGQYDLRRIVFKFDSQEPTVKLGVGKSEAVIDKLKSAVCRGLKRGNLISELVKVPNRRYRWRELPREENA